MGAQTTTFGTPGVEEYCNYLKQVGDAQQIKNAIVNCFESAGLPNLTDEEIEKELTFVIVGAGPTGKSAFVLFYLINACVQYEVFEL